MAIVGVARSEETTRRSATDMKEAVAGARPRRVPRGRLGRARGTACTTSRPTSPTTGGEDELRDLLGRAGRGAWPRAATASTTSQSLRCVSDDRRASSASAARQRLDAADRREAVRPRPRVRARAERAAVASTSTRARCFGSTTTSARRRSRTCSRSDSRTASSSRSGIASSSITSRSRWPSRSDRGRAGYYERAGAIRDIFQNHLLQLLALTAMEPPIDFTAESVRNEKVKVLRAMHTPGPKSGRPRPVWAGVRRGRRGPRLPRRGGRRARFDDGDLRRGEALRRQLALG